ncbi:hypothetical protein FHETE_7160 [Fusarium heterosporum]|uniref:Uncharacterized protein n=1 Tax=Fusarium heterosporum TaxID=42747 RepID=A0A8H5WN73_FUSHE|nr:hypothetical protein FHETE_7160 [Fusarium heterosporum]
MATLSTSPLPTSVYNSLPTDRTLFDDETMTELAAVFSAYNVGDSIGLTILHRHYQLDNGNVMVHDGLKCRSVLVNDEDKNMFDGQSFFVYEDGFQAYEFCVGESPLELDLKFLKHIQEYILSANLQRRVALTRLSPKYKMLLEYEQPQFQGCIRVPGIRKNVQPEDVTTWKFDGGVGEFLPVQSCYQVGDKHESRA